MGQLEQSAFKKMEHLPDNPDLAMCGMNWPSEKEVRN
jgi:hypothetical protein